jgi:hypothetical protein
VRKDGLRLMTTSTDSQTINALLGEMRKVRYNKEEGLTKAENPEYPQTVAECSFTDCLHYDRVKMLCPMDICVYDDCEYDGTQVLLEEDDDLDFDGTYEREMYWWNYGMDDR